MTNLNNAIHIRNVLSLLKQLEDIGSYLTYEDFREDDLTRMNSYRILTLIGIEAFNIRGESGHDTSVTTLRSFMKADYITGFGQEEYAVWCFIRNDISFLESALETVLTRHMDKYQHILNENMNGQHLAMAVTS